MKSEEFVFKTGKIRMSRKKLYDFTYATIMLKVEVLKFHGIGIYQFNKKQNAYNNVTFLIKIHPNVIDKFEIESGVTLENPTVL